MKARPILFSAPMVRALLAGTKTQTRRAVKRPKTVPLDYIQNPSLIIEKFMTWWAHPGGLAVGHSQVCPYGQSGDLLWVREAHYIIGEHAGQWPGSRWTHYAADLSNNLGDTDHQWTRGWKPSIHMPRSSSRLTLRITDVRVQRLQEISEADALAEGVERSDWQFSCEPFRNYSQPRMAPGKNCSTARKSFNTLWESINGAGSWDANPWVWAITFEVIKANVDAVLRQKAAA